MARKLWLAALLIGMTTSSPSLAEGGAEQNPTPDLATDGYFVVRLVNKAPQVAFGIPEFTHISITGEAVDEEARRFPVVATGSPSFNRGRPTLTVGGWLPARRYRIARFEANIGQVLGAVNIQDSLPQFTVSAGQVTDLGVLVFQPVGGGEAVVIPAAGTAPIGEVISRYLLPDSAVTSTLPVGRWDLSDGWKPLRLPFGGVDYWGPPRGLFIDLMATLLQKGEDTPRHISWESARTATEYLALAKHFISIQTLPAEAPDGTAYFGSTLGQVFRRSPDGKWELLDTNQLSEITAVHVTEDGELYAGTEDGQILRQAKPGESFSPVGRSPDGGRVVDIRRLAADRWVLVTRLVQAGGVGVTNVYLGASASQFSPQPARVFTQDVDPGPMASVKPYPEPAMGKSRYLIGVLGKAPEAYDVPTSSWVKYGVKTKGNQILANSSGSVLQRIHPVRISLDDGNTWNRLKFPGHAHYVAFFDSRNAMAVIRGNEFYRSEDGGKKWERVNRLPENACAVDTLRPIDRLKRLVCNFRDGTTHSTGMTGEWTQEFPTQAQPAESVQPRQ